MAERGADYLIQLGLDTSRLKKEYPKVFKELSAAQSKVNTMLKVELGLHKKILSGRQATLSLTEKQIRAQQKLNALQGKTTRIPRTSTVSPTAAPKVPKDPMAVSARSKEGLSARLGHEIARSHSDVTLPEFQAQIAASKKQLRGLRDELKKATSVGQVTKLRERFKDINNEIRETVRSQRTLNRELKKGSAIGTKFAGSMKSMSLYMVSAYAAINVGREVFRVGKEFDAMQAGLLAASDSAVAAKDNFKFLLDTAKRLGTDVESGAKGFNRLGVAMKGSGFSPEDIKKVFTSTQEAIATFQLTPEKANLVMVAMGQIASKAKVSYEELGRQLGDSLPIAMQAAEKATGKTTSEVLKMMENGELMGKTFLVPFAKAMSEIVRENQALEKATQKLTSQQNRMNTAYKELVNDIFQKGGGVQLFSAIFRDVAEVISTIRPIIVDVFNVILSSFRMTWDIASTLVGTVLDLIGAIYKLGKEGSVIKSLSILFYGFEVAVYSVLTAIEELRMMLRGDKEFNFVKTMQSITKLNPSNLGATVASSFLPSAAPASNSTSVGTLNLYSTAATTEGASRDLVDQFLLQVSM